MATREDITDLTDMVSDAIERAFARGVEVGGNRMRAKIMEVASGDGNKVQFPWTQSTEKTAKKVAKRARKGAVGVLLKRILTNHPGLKIVEIETAAKTMDATLAVKSLGNELRRLEGEKYKRDVQDRWFLMD